MDELTQIQENLKEVDIAKWYLGDLANIATYEWGKKYDKWEEATGIPAATLRLHAKVSTRFPVEFRQRIYESTKNLRWEHFYAVRLLSDEYAEYYLRKANKERWSAKRLTIEVKPELKKIRNKRLEAKRLRAERKGNRDED